MSSGIVRMMPRVCRVTIAWTAEEDVSVDMSLGEGQTTQNRKRDDGITHNRRCESNQPHYMGSF